MRIAFFLLFLFFIMGKSHKAKTLEQWTKDLERYAQRKSSLPRAPSKKNANKAFVLYEKIKECRMHPENKVSRGQVTLAPPSCTCSFHKGKGKGEISSGDSWLDCMWKDAPSFIFQLQNKFELPSTNKCFLIMVVVLFYSPFPPILFCPHSS